MLHSLSILERFRTAYGRDIDLTLRPAYRDLLAKLGNPQDHLPPVFHVAGTNGKGSTCAFLRAFLEAQGHKVHVHTSPHLVRFHERIRIAGELISEEELAAILSECETKAELGYVSYFELATAATFVAFARHPADYTILEVGLGGRLDATNVIPRSLATLITRLSYDHRDYLGDTLEKIASEKAGIMRAGIPCFVAHQPDEAAEKTLLACAAKLKAPLFLGGRDWKIKSHNEGFEFEQGSIRMDLPRPALLGNHQCGNAGLALAALCVLPKALSLSEVKRGLQTVFWPARLQKLEGSKLWAHIPYLAKGQADIWLDGGHNDSAGEVLAEQIKLWRQADGATPRPLCVILGMLSAKNPHEFLAPFADLIDDLALVPIPDEPLSLTSSALKSALSDLNLKKMSEKENVLEALQSLSPELLKSHPRILICGSLYLAGYVLALLEETQAA